MAVQASTEKERVGQDRITVVMWVCVALALVAGSAYILSDLGVLQAGDLGSDEAPPGIGYVAAGGYILGGLLILLRKRWLWIVGAVINALVIVMFFAMWAGRPEVLLCSAGLVTKAAQILLEIGLIYLILAYKPGNKPAEGCNRRLAQLKKLGQFFCACRYGRHTGEHTGEHTGRHKAVLRLMPYSLKARCPVLC